MPFIVAFLFVASIVFFVKICWMTILYTGGAAASAAIFWMVVSKIYLRRNARRAARDRYAQDTAAYGFLRDEPLAEG
jgi:hypothetical protein